MRILHTSDWHIGRTFHGHQTLNALADVLAVLVAQVRSHRVDVVVVAGDVFDSSTPAAGCYTLLTDTLVALRETGATVIVTSGNHDSAARLGFQAKLLRDGIHILTDPLAIGTPITVADAHGPVHFYGIPFLEPTLVRHLWEGLETRTQAQTLAHAMELVRSDAAARRADDGTARTVAIAHCFAAGVAATPHLERDIQQGGLDVVPLSTFNGVDYMALGHIHGRSRLSDTVRYAGAPLHYSFGEGDKPRGSWLIDLDDAGFAAAQWLDLPVPRPLVTLRGALDELLTDERFAAVEAAWVRAEYTDTAQQVDVMRRLQQRFPHCAEVRHAPAVRAVDDGETFAGRVRAARDDAALVDAFLVHVRNGEGVTAAEAELVREVIGDRVAAKAMA
ncbi:MAG: exonuclease SbcCD subunit D [Microbacterium sp.]|uniref:exonuclease SbcCD subunit D n=1 Tax=Microbacterium sp. TaxID=51671 RepID=UPI003A88B6B3